jgi:hypothetical protein
MRTVRVEMTTKIFLSTGFITVYKIWEPCDGPL